jgi:hypothetical protein
MRKIRVLTSKRKYNSYLNEISVPIRRGADNLTLEKTLVTKSVAAIAGYFSCHKLLRKARAHVGLSSH